MRGPKKCCSVLLDVLGLFSSPTSAGQKHHQSRPGVLLRSVSHCLLFNLFFFSWIFYSEFHAPALPFLCCRWPNMDLQAATTRERPSSCCVPVKMHVLSVRLFYLTCEYLHVSLLLFLLCESDVFSETSDTSCGCECVHHWVWCVRINQTLALSLSLLFLWGGGFWEQTFFPSVGVGERLLSITVWWNAGLIRGPPMVLSQWQRVPGSECEAPDNPQTHWVLQSPELQTPAPIIALQTLGRASSFGAER